jgi:hypothetical protein
MRITEGGRTDHTFVDICSVPFSSPIHELVTKNQEDALTPSEKADLESYLHVSSILDLMHAKACRSLKKRP